MCSPGFPLTVRKMRAMKKIALFPCPFCGKLSYECRPLLWRQDAANDPAPSAEVVPLFPEREGEEE